MDGLSGIGIVASLQGGAALLTGLVVNGVTLAWPERPPWAAWALAMVLGILFTALVAVATLPEGTPWTVRTFAQVAIVGIITGSAAAGVNSTQRKADEGRIAAVQQEIDAERIRTKVGWK